MHVVTARAIAPTRIATLDTLPQAWRGGVVAIGNFDGVHRGHQAVLAAARELAARRGAPCLMLSFEPHPRAFFSGRPLFRLTPLPLKAAIGAALGLDGMLVLDFDRALAEHTAEEFVAGTLVDRLRIAAAVTGHDFHFGRRRQGSPDFLREAGARYGFTVEVVQALREGADAVSSTRIRAALEEGDITAANALLGWTWSVAGPVIHGEKRGRALGYPTANMMLDAATELKQGIYAVRVQRLDGSRHEGVASFGRRPTFGGGEPLLETYLFEFDGDLYGEALLVSLAEYLRPELKFDSANALIGQMDRDVAAARARLEASPAGKLDRRIGEAWAALAVALEPNDEAGWPRPGEFR